MNHLNPNAFVSISAVKNKQRNLRHQRADNLVTTNKGFAGIREHVFGRKGNHSSTRCLWSAEGKECCLAKMPAIANHVHPPYTEVPTTILKIPRTMSCHHNPIKSNQIIWNVSLNCWVVRYTDIMEFRSLCTRHVVSPAHKVKAEPLPNSTKSSS